MKNKVINTGMDTVFNASEMIFQLINTPEIGRSGHIRQIGIGNMVYPSVTNTRKTHLLDTAYAGTVAFDAIRKKCPEKGPNSIPPDSEQTLEAAAILHDIGHGPLSHTTERILNKINGKSHEQIAADIIQGKFSFVEYFSERPHLLGEPKIINKILERYKQLPSIPEILDKNYVNADVLVQVLDPGRDGEELDPRYMFIKNLIDGSLVDIDKIAYLARDSKEANVKEGNADPSRLMNGFRIFYHKGDKRLAIRDKTLDNLAMIVGARKWMFRHVYQHKTVLTFEAMLCEALKRSRDAFRENDIEAHLLTDEQLLHNLRQYDEVSADLSMRIEYARDLKYVTAFSIKGEEVETHDYSFKGFRRLNALAGYMQSSEREFPEDDTRDEIVAIANKMPGREIKSHEVVIHYKDVPKTEEQYKKKLDILVYNNDDPPAVCPISEIAEGNAGIVHGTADRVLQRLCETDTSTYFGVYCDGNDIKYRVHQATEELLDHITKPED